MAGAEGNWHTQRVLCEFDTTLNPTVTSGMVGDLRSPPKYPGASLIPGPTSILPAPWILSHVLIHSFLPVHLILCPTIIHASAICCLHKGS